jgi:NhaP-type Na+/H+ or K+/H+ antiporter
MTTEMFVGILGLVGAVIMITSLMSGWVERANLPQVAIFLLLGAVLGPAVLGLMDFGLESPVLRVVATLSLALVLFTDAVTISFSEVRKRARLATVILGPGTLIAACVVAVLGKLILGLDWASSFVLAAPIASTDPVLLRGLLRRRDLPEDARTALRLESSLNDVVLLPVLLVAMAFVPGAVEKESMARLLLNLFILGPLAGVAVGFVAVLLLRQARTRIGIRRDYESIYSLGVCFASFAAGEALHGSGFLAAFFAGFVIARLDDDLCDCFIEYGETTAEMLLMFTFVLLGGSLIWAGFGSITVAVAAFVVLALFVRPIVLLIALAFEKVDKKSRFFITWFGPRGLSTLLLALVPAFVGIPGAEGLFAISGLVVLLSVLIHGGSIMFLGKMKPPPPSELIRLSPKASAREDVLVRVEELPPEMRLADVRSSKSLHASPYQLRGAVRLDPEHPARDAQRFGFDEESWIALFCT